GTFVVALSGGSTPRSMYARLAAEPDASGVNWSLVQVLWGDERCVPPDHAASNYRMAREALLDHVSIPAANVHRIRGEDDPAEAATVYERVLRHVLRTPLAPPRDAPRARLARERLAVVAGSGGVPGARSCEARGAAARVGAPVGERGGPALRAGGETAGHARRHRAHPLPQARRQTAWRKRSCQIRPAC